jgi:hypothetical protein
MFMERNKLFRARFIILKCIEVMESYKRRAELEGNIEGRTPDTFQNLIDNLKEMEESLNG